jgi:Thioredoxin domain-containing protein
MRFKAPFFYLLAVLATFFQAVSSNAFAQQPHFDNDSFIQPTEPEKQPSIGVSGATIFSPSTPWHPQNEDNALSEFTSAEEELHKNPDLAEQLINTNLVNQNWNVLAELLPIYAQIEGHDPILLSYAQGAFYRHQGKHGLAIAEYRSILASSPELVYVRFDLAAMLFENKEYEAAKDQFHKVKAADLPEPLPTVINQYLEAIQKQTGWDFNAGLQYTRTDNVNNASSIEEIKIGSLIFVKNEDALPQSANGISYNLGASRDIPLQGQHYAVFNTRLYGIDYWDNKDYSELTIRAGAGYKYQNFQTEFSLIPFIEQSWLGGQRYGFNQGIGLELRQWLNHQNQIAGTYHYINKSYINSAYKRYEGQLQHVSLSLIHFFSPTLIFIGGVDAQWDNLNGKDESSEKYGVHAGVIKEWGSSISTRTNVRFARRTFNDEHFLMPQTRKDNEYQLDLSFWHRKIYWRGITPRLNFRYIKIDSNIPEFYTRDSRQFFISFEKTF